MKAMKVTAAGRASGSASHSHTGNPITAQRFLIMGGEVVASLPQGIQRTRSIQLNPQDYVSASVIEREARTSASQEGDDGRIGKSSPPIAAVQGGEKKGKKKKKKKGKKSPNSGGTPLSVPGVRGSQMRREDVKPPHSQKGQATPPEQPLTLPPSGPSKIPVPRLDGGQWRERGRRPRTEEGRRAKNQPAPPPNQRSPPPPLVKERGGRKSHRARQR